MQVPKNALKWFEIPVSNFDRARKFYNTVFNFELLEAHVRGNRMGLFPCDEGDGGVGGAIVEGPDAVPSQRGCVVYLYCGPDLTEVLDRVPGAGGRILHEKAPISPEKEMGYQAVFTDTEGNRIGLHSEA
ncbi:VOC family protein [Chitinophaga barathri]|uniref:VOC family protein n=1 Tax=Chitinophaga barathri TaxID=1647451 RepID=A0A3N4MNS7_9BACT|nr:VOC family protein [Chitinophaga barathri]RPD41319.1 VOC family protein [Chitinophaga barathri]